MKIVNLNPCYVRLPSDDEEVKRFLTYTDRAVGFQIKRLKALTRYRGEWVQNKIEDLKGQTKVTLLWYTDEGEPYTLAGIVPQILQRFKDWSYDYKVPTAEGRAFPYAHQPKHKNRYYQDEAFQALIKAGHAAISLPTAAGKTSIIRDLAKYNPVKTVIVAPLTSVANQLYKNLVHLFGPKWVGKYGDGSKKSDKLITVAVAQSLVALKEDSEHYANFKKTIKFIVDESHTLGADTLSDMALGIFRDAPQRYFVSATQIRNDGSQMLLDGITGPIVYRKEFSELVQEGFLAKPKFMVFNVLPNYANVLNHSDAKTETRNQLYNNPNVAKLAGDIATKMINTGKQVLILVEEFRQFDLLKNHIAAPFVFLHGGVSKDAKDYVQPQFWACDIDQSVADFNAGKIRGIVGTSAVSTGTDFIPVDCIIYIQGGTSEIKVKQAIGRATRLAPNKKEFWAIDFCVAGSSTLERHSAARVDLYRSLWDDVKFI